MPTYTVPDNITLHAGPVLVGIVLNWWLFGILCVQYYLYLSKTKEEKRAIKIIVHVIFILDAFQTLMLMEDAFYWFVYNYGSFEKLNEFHMSQFNMALVDIILGFIVQMFYIWRINHLSGWKLLPGILALGSFAGVIPGVLTIFFWSARIGLSNPTMTVMIWLLASAITDIFIALTTGYLLLRMAKERPSQATSNVILRILALTLETNAVTSAVAVEIVIVYFTKSIATPRTGIFITGGYVLGKLYSNCFMIFLNQRQHYRDNNTQIIISGDGSRALQEGPVTSSTVHTVSTIEFSQVVKG